MERRYVEMGGGMATAGLIGGGNVAQVAKDLRTVCWGLDENLRCDKDRSEELRRRMAEETEELVNMLRRVLRIV